MFVPTERLVGGGGRHQLRISSSYLTPDQVAEGVARLAAFITVEADDSTLAGRGYRLSNDQAVRGHR